MLFFRLILYISNLAVASAMTSASVGSTEINMSSSLISEANLSIDHVIVFILLCFLLLCIYTGLEPSFNLAALVTPVGTRVNRFDVHYCTPSLTPTVQPLFGSFDFSSVDFRSGRTMVSFLLDYDVKIIQIIIRCNSLCIYFLVFNVI